MSSGLGGRHFRYNFFSSGSGKILYAEKEEEKNEGEEGRERKKKREEKSKSKRY